MPRPVPKDGVGNSGIAVDCHHPVRAPPHAARCGGAPTIVLNHTPRPTFLSHHLSLALFHLMRPSVARAFRPDSGTHPPSTRGQGPRRPPAACDRCRKLLPLQDLTGSARLATMMRWWRDLKGRHARGSECARRLMMWFERRHDASRAAEPQRAPEPGSVSPDSAAHPHS